MDSGRGLATWRVLAPNFGRFRSAWLAFGLAISTAAVPVLLTYWILDHTDGAPWSMVIVYPFIWCAASLLGVVVVPFRRFFAGPQFPFVRPGFGLVALTPLLFHVRVYETGAERARTIIGFEVFLVLGLLIFVALGRRLGAFEELAEAPAPAARIDGTAAFFLAWAVLLVSLAGGTVATGVPLSLVDALEWPINGGQGAVTPGALSLYAAIAVVAGGVLLGAPFVRFRSHIVRPDLPFVRPGYLAVAALPFLVAMVAYATNGEVAMFWFAGLAQIPLLLAALIYVLIARLCGLFPDEDRIGAEGAFRPADQAE